jgi:ribosome-associated translation inhibitor RaiA
MEPSEAVAMRIRAESAKLDRYFNRITSCRVLVEAPHRHHRWGEPFHIRIELSVPGTEIVVKHAPSLHSALARAEMGKWSKHFEAGVPHKDMYVTIRDAFRAARRRLEDYVRRLRGDVKVHGRVPPVRADKLGCKTAAGF